MSSHIGEPFVPGVRAPDPRPDRAQWYLFFGDDLIMQDDDDRLKVPIVADPAEFGLVPVRVQYLGCRTDQEAPLHCYAGELLSLPALPKGFVPIGLRQLFHRLDGLTTNLAGRAKQVAAWDRDHRYCGRCGAPLARLEHERAKRCPNCGLTTYPRISPAIIVAITRRTAEGLQILLARGHRFPPDRYSVIAGFVEPGESLEQSVRREIAEEVGIQVRSIRYFGSQSWPFPNSLMFGFTAEYAGGEIRLEEEEIADAGWFAYDNLPQVPSGISISRRLIDWYVEKAGGDPDKVEEWQPTS